jgi:hypothetical protein
MQQFIAEKHHTTILEREWKNGKMKSGRTTLQFSVLKGVSTCI